MRAARHRADPRWSEGLLDLARLVLPTACAGCGWDDVPLCQACHRRLAGPAYQVEVLTHPHAPATWSTAQYAGTTRQVVVAWKDRGRHDLAPVLAWSLARSAEAALVQLSLAEQWPQQRRPPGGPVLLVPAPSSRAASRARGGDVLAAVARRAAAVLQRRGWDVAVACALRQRAGVRDQAGLGVASRSANVTGSFRAGGRWLAATSPCLLLDDVVTTGATLAEARRVLVGVGSVVVGAAVVAATPVRRSQVTAGLSGGPGVD